MAAENCEAFECSSLVGRLNLDSDPSRKASMLSSCHDNSTCRVAFERCVSEGAPGDLEKCGQSFEACAQPCIMDTDVKAKVDSWCSGLTQLSSMRDIRDSTDTTDTTEPSPVAAACRKFVEDHYVFDHMGSHSFDSQEDAMEHFCGADGVAFNPKWATCEPQIQGIRIDGCTAIVKGTLKLADDRSEPASWNVVRTGLCNQGVDGIKFVG
jgi:hypothetical protein